MLRRKSKIIVIIGNVGAGKSTLGPILARKLSAKYVKADHLYLTNPFFPEAVKNRSRWSLTSDLWFLKERVKILKKQLTTNKKFIVIDSGLPMSWIYAHSRLQSRFYTKEEWKIYQEYFNFLTKGVSSADILINLKAPLNFLMERIQTRGRDYEKKYFNVAYLASLHNSLKEFIKQTSAKKIVAINIEKNDLNKQSGLNLLVKKILKQ